MVYKPTTLSHFLKKPSDEKSCKQSVSQRTYTCLWLVFCLVGATFQVYKISAQFFAYDISTNVQLRVDDEMDIPTLNFCFEQIVVIDWKKTTQKERLFLLHSPETGFPKLDYDVNLETNASLNRLGNIIRDIIDITLRNDLTASFQKLKTSRMFETTYGISTLVSLVRAYTEYDRESNTSQTIKAVWGQDLGKYFETKSFFKDKNKCFSFEPKPENRRIKYYHVMRRDITPGAVYIMALNSFLVSTIITMYFIMTPNNQVMTNGFFAFVPVHLTQLDAQFLSYDTFERKLLPKPYSTGCFDYKKLRRGLRSRGECYESCIRKGVKKATNGSRIPPSLNLYSNAKERVIPFDEFWSEDVIPGSNESFIQLMFKLESSCEKECAATDCKSIDYIPKRLSSTKFGIPSLGVFAPFSPTVSASCHEAMSVVQYLTDVVSSLGFWLGVSAIGFMDILKILGKAIFNAYFVTQARLLQLKDTNQPSKRHSKKKAAKTITGTTMGRRVHYKERHKWIELPSVSHLSEQDMFNAVFMAGNDLCRNKH